MKSMLARLQAAQTTTFDQAFEDFADKATPVTLTDEDIAIIFGVSETRISQNEEIVTELPEELQALFQECRKMQTTRGAFFNRFCLFMRPPIDGVLIGFGTDEYYYVLGTWDHVGHHAWKPTCDAFERSVIN